MVTAWRFGSEPQDGEAWLQHPSALFIYVDYQKLDSDGESEWRRLMVVTKSWMEKHLAGVKHGATGPLWAGLPPMLVVPDATGEDLRGVVDTVIRQGGFDSYSFPASVEP